MSCQACKINLAERMQKVKEYQIGNAIVCVTRPELTEAEQKRREARIAAALQNFGKAAERKAVRV